MSARSGGSGARGLTVVGASAGSGKTHHLTHAVLDALSSGEVPLEGLVAVTYTKRAQLELASRIRRTLLASPDPGRAAHLPLANVGTVHAACLRLLRELALDAGLSPEVDVLVHEDQLLRAVLEEELGEALRDELLALAQAMAIGRDQQSRVDWATPVLDVITLARHGRIRGAELPAMARRSLDTFFALFPPPATEDLDDLLRAALEDAAQRLAGTTCRTKATQGVREEIGEVTRRLARGPLDWPTWARLGKLAPGRAAREAVEGVVAVAQRVLEHPRLRRDVERYVTATFEAAARALDAYSRAKDERRVVDYADMIDRALSLLSDPDVAADLAERLRLVVVDELQDSSPIQLALFLRLHQLAGTSRWVGDPKQCIFEYAGADPALMDAVLAWSARTGGAAHRLADNHRSRPELVRLCNELFSTAFAAHDVGAEDVVVSPVRPPGELSDLPPLGVWHLEARSADAESAALAEGVRQLLLSGERTPVLDRATGGERPVAPGDVAVLVATNAEAIRLSSELAARGVPSAVARPGLLATPEGVALQSALGLLLDPGAEQERAVLHALAGLSDRGEWLSDRIRVEATRRDARVRGEPPPARPAPPAGSWEARLDAVRAVSATASPTEVVDALLSALDLATLCVRWPDAPQRLANLDALRALAADYEGQCVDLAEGASIAGLLRFLQDLATPRALRGELLAVDDQAEARGDHAVTILTYHRSKGLEWPVVILSSLHRKARRTPFEVAPERDGGDLDPDAPLRDRWIRLWPRPFGPTAGHDLVDRAMASPEGLGVSHREARERVRLLYVGFTRARDHLILAVRSGATGWLDELQAPDGSPALRLPPPPARGAEAPADAAPARRRGATNAAKATKVPATAGRAVIARGGGAEEEVPARVAVVTAGDDVAAAPAEVRWFPRSSAEDRAPYRVRPSDGEDAPAWLPRLRVGDLEPLSGPLLLPARSDAEWSTVGDAVHAFLAADGPGLVGDARWAVAQRRLEPVGLGGAEAVASVLGAADALRAWADRVFPGARWRREVPVRAKVGAGAEERQIVGSIDLLLELPSGGVVVIDHKSDRVGDPGAMRARAAVHAPQLAAYAAALAAAGREVTGCFVHFVVGGAIVALVPGA